MPLNLRIISDMMSGDGKKQNATLQGKNICTVIAQKGVIHENTIFNIRAGTGHYKDI